MFDIWTPRHQSDDPTEQAFIESLNRHISYVQEAGAKIGVHPRQLEIHDNSKWSDAEFQAYAKHFHGGGVPDLFASAWLRHIHLNPHHWQHWIYPDGYTPKGSNIEKGVVQMPNIYALEMVADWMGASRAYTGSWDMKDWLWKNMPKIRVHSETAEFLRQTLDTLGYADVVWVQKFAHEEGKAKPGDIKRMDIKEFRETGYLQELNRQFLHPFGLALEVIVEEDGTETLGGVWDYRNDPEGLRFNDDEIDLNKIRRVENILTERIPSRKEKLGYYIQPAE
jgi:hypothetical protein